MHFFGEPWNIPTQQLTQRVHAPVGAKCTTCWTPIQHGDRGLISGDITPVGCLDISHRECQLLIDVGHDYDMCDHARGRRSPEQKRADALELWAKLHPDE